MRLNVRQLGLSDYETVWKSMKVFTDSRTESTEDELWITQHRPVFTLGQAAETHHLLNSSEIPVVRTDRGGQITYHGPGQIVGYLLRDLRRQRETVHQFVNNLEKVMIQLLETYGITAERLANNPGVYVAGKKIGAIGLRIRKGCSYHGISLNVDMDLSPFQQINPCGLVGMLITQIADFVPEVKWEETAERAINHYKTIFGYEESTYCTNDIEHFSVV